MLPPSLILLRLDLSRLITILGDLNNQRTSPPFRELKKLTLATLSPVVRRSKSIFEVRRFLMHCGDLFIFITKNMMKEIDLSQK